MVGDTPDPKPPRRSSHFKGTAQPYYSDKYYSTKQLVEGASLDDKEKGKGNFLANLEFDDDLLSFAGCLIAEESANTHETLKTFTQAMWGSNANE